MAPNAAWCFLENMDPGKSVTSKRTGPHETRYSFQKVRSIGLRGIGYHGEPEVPQFYVIPKDP